MGIKLNSKVAVIGGESDNSLVKTVNQYGFQAHLVENRYDPGVDISSYVNGAHNIVARASSIASSGGSKLNFLKAAKKYFSDQGIFNPVVLMIADENVPPGKLLNEYTSLKRREVIMAYFHPEDDVAKKVMQNLFIASSTNSTRAIFKKESLETSVLLVEDDASIVELLKMELSSGVYGDQKITLDVATNTYEAIKAMRSKSYRVAVLDKFIPGSDRMDVYELASWMHQVYPFTETILMSGNARHADEEYFGNKIIRKGENIEEKTLELALANAEISKRKIVANLRNSHGRIYLLGASRGGGKTTIAHYTKRVLPWVYVPKRPVSREPRPNASLDFEDHTFVSEEEIKSHVDDPNWIVFQKEDNDTRTKYWGGIDLSDIDSHLREGYDIVMPLAEPKRLEEFFNRYGPMLIKTILVNNPNPMMVSSLVEDRDDRPFTPEQVMMDQRKYRIFERPYIIPNMINPFKLADIATKNLNDPIEMAKSGYIDQWVTIFCNKIRMDRYDSQSIYSFTSARKSYAK